LTLLQGKLFIKDESKGKVLNKKNVVVRDVGKMCVAGAFDDNVMNVSLDFWYIRVL